jgi:putative colanic acid biosynthesis UDP-glucose lipid carrier transferase
MAANPLEHPPHESLRRFAASESEIDLLSAVLLPAVAMAVYGGFMHAFSQALDGPHFLLGLLGVLAAGEVSSDSRAYGSEGAARGELIRLSWRWAVVVLVAWAGIELAGIERSVNVQMLISVAVTMPLALWGAEQSILQWNLRRGSPASPRRAIVIGLTDIGSRWEANLLQNLRFGVKVQAFFDDRRRDRLTGEHHAALMGTLADVPRYVAEHGIQIVYITLPISRHPRLLTLLDGLRDSTVSIYFLPDIYAFNPLGARIECIDGVPLLAVQESPFAGPAALVKRLVDIGAAAAALLVLAIPMLLIALLIRLTSEGPVIFKQRRYGLDGEPIVIFKFRTMTVVEDGDLSYTQVLRGDSRVTQLGAFMRATSLDELPQLFNVLQGTMSLVGPRPHAIAVNEQYRHLIPSYMLRHKVKPGITGLAQVHGYRGGDDLASMTKRIEYDLAYMQHWSLGLDMQIIWRTAALVWNDRNAF